MLSAATEIAQKINCRDEICGKANRFYKNSIEKGKLNAMSYEKSHMGIYKKLGVDLHTKWRCDKSLPDLFDFVKHCKCVWL